MKIDIRLNAADRLAVVVLRGALNGASAPGVTSSLAIIARRRVDVDLDMAGVTVIDAVGIDALVESAKTFEQQGTTLRVVNADRSVRRAPRRCPLGVGPDEFDRSGGSRVRACLAGQA